MTIANKKRIHGAILSTLKPIAGLLMRNGVGAREFCELAKTAFVDVVTQTYGIRGRPTNLSRTAILTDLTRKEVRRIRDKLDTDQALAMPRVPFTERLLERWSTDPIYLDSTGKPKSVPLEGPSPSFGDLAHHVGTDVPTGALLAELTRDGAIALEEKGLVAVQDNLARMTINAERVVSGFSNAIEPVCQCVAHNLENEEDEQWPTITFRSESIHRKDAQRFRSISRKYMTKLRNDIESLFLAYETMQSEEEKESGDICVSIAVVHCETPH